MSSSASSNSTRLRSDEFTRLALGCHVDLSIGTSDGLERRVEIFAVRASRPEPSR
jgi:hypothetical protein